MTYKRTDRPTAQELSARPTTCQGQESDLKLDTGDVRFWLSRCGLEDGTQYQNTVYIEVLTDEGRWEDYATYDGGTLEDDEDNDSSVHFHVGHNVAGYMPESDVSTYATFDEAKRALIADLKYAEDAAGMMANEEGWEAVAEDLASTAENVNLWSGPDTTYIEGQPGEHIIPTAYWVTECAETDCELDDDEEGF